MIDQAERDQLEERIVAALKTVYDPEIPVDIHALGLIYGVDIDDERFVTVTMTLTTPNCPEAEAIPGRVSQAVLDVEGVSGVHVDLVWEPVWNKDMMSEAARLQLGFF
jgi:FeS assembly SUF system protein